MKKLFFIVPSTALLFTLTSLTQVLSLKKREANLLRQINGFKAQSRAFPSIGHADTGLEGTVSEIAKIAHLQKLLSLGTSEERDSKNLHVDWESDQNSSLRFLALLERSGVAGNCLKLQLTNSEQAPTRLRGRAVFELGKGHSSSVALSTAAASGLRLVRNVFTPLWISKVETPLIVVQPKISKKEKEARLLEQERLEQERKRRDESERLEAKKRELQSNVILTGIVNNSKEPFAFVSTRGNSQTLMLRKGDTVQEAQVIQIDERKGEMRLDYSGKFQIVVKLNSLGFGNNP